SPPSMSPRPSSTAPSTAPAEDRVGLPPFPDVRGWRRFQTLPSGGSDAPARHPPDGGSVPSYGAPAGAHRLDRDRCAGAALPRHGLGSSRGSHAEPQDPLRRRPAAPAADPGDRAVPEGARAHAAREGGGPA